MVLKYVKLSSKWSNNTNPREQKGCIWKKGTIKIEEKKGTLANHPQKSLAGQ